MRDREHKQLLNDVTELRQLVAARSTEGIVGACFVYWLRRDSLVDDFGLLSAARQWEFLLGLMLGTPEPAAEHPFERSDMERVCELLNKIFSSYAWTYWPEAGEDITEEWRRTREVAMPAFLAYMNQGLMASTQQVEQRVRRYLSPFDRELHSDLGLDASQAADMCRWITDRLQHAADLLVDAARLERESRLDLLKRAQSERWTTERLRGEVQQPGYERLASELFAGLRALGAVSRTALVERFGESSATAFWTLFAATRGEGKALTYPTEENIASTRSLYVLSDDRAVCPLANHLFQALLHRFERHLSSGPHRDRFFRRRDAQLEDEVEQSFRSIFGGETEFHRGVFETPDQHFEHDFVVRVARTAIIVEAKASPPVEPFRDPDKAFVRIRDAFRSSRGIQHAFEQGRRIFRTWTKGERVQLYDEQSRVKCAFDKRDVDEVLLVCATRDDFGFLATDLSLLLEKEPEDPYPWAVNAIDLDAIADAWTYFRWDGQQFLTFLRDRVQLHGRTFCSDELEAVGFFIKHGGLHSIIEQPADRIWINPAYSTVFDDIYKAKVGAGPNVVYAPEPVHWTDAREVLRGGQPTGQVRAPLQKQGRNDPCACGSGKKYKKCHGR